MDAASALISTALHETKPTDQAASNINMNIPPSARESTRPLQRGTNHSFVSPVSLSSFLNKHVLLQELLQEMHSLRNILESLESANRHQTSADKSLQSIVVYGHYLQNGPANSRQVLLFHSSGAINWLVLDLFRTNWT